MWNLSYMENGEIKVKRFKSDKEADDWINSKQSQLDFVPFNLGVWSELLQCYRTVYTYNEYQEWQEEIIMNIRVTVGTNTSRKNVIVDSSTTLRNVLEENNIDYSRANVNLDGASLNPGDMDKSFADLGIAESCFLIASIKQDNAR